MQPLPYSWLDFTRWLLKFSMLWALRFAMKCFSKALSKAISKVLSKQKLSILMKQVFSCTPNPNEEGWSLPNPKNTKLFQRHAKVYHCYHPTVVIEMAPLVHRLGLALNLEGYFNLTLTEPHTNPRVKAPAEPCTVSSTCKSFPMSALHCTLSHALDRGTGVHPLQEPFQKVLQDHFQNECFQP